MTNLKTLGNYDVIVCGGGPAGFCAGIQAARLGCKTAILERYGMLGGAMTVGGVPFPALFHAWGKQVIAGIGWELMERLAKEGWAVLPDPESAKPHPQMAVKVNGPMAAWMLDNMCQEAKVDLLFHQPAVDVPLAAEKNLAGIIISTKEGLRLIRGKVIIDCTGDGDIAAWAGADYELGAELQPGTLGFYLQRTDSVDKKQLDPSFRAARSKGTLLHGDFWAEHSNAETILGGLNVNHVELNGADSVSRSRAEIQGRQSLARICHWLRTVAGGEEITPLTTAPEVWARESRRILGEAYITAEAYLEAKIHPDAVCHSFYPIDLHTTSEGNLKNIFLEEGKVPTIPLGAMVPRGFENLLVAGRCISGDRLAQSAYRVQASCMAMGQAAGAAAALAIEDNCSVGKVDLDRLKKNLAKQGAIVPEI